MVRAWPRQGGSRSRADATHDPPIWKKVAAKFAEYSDARGTPELLVALAMGRVTECPFDAVEVSKLLESIVAEL